MMRLAWMTDIHLNFLGAIQIDNWLTAIKQEKFQALLITGDIGEANTLEEYLIRLQGRLNVPIYFVLGNHDYYHSSIADVRAHVLTIHNQHSGLNWLPEQGIVKLNEATGLVGHGGWGDGGYGHFYQSSLMLNDYTLIQELSDLSANDRFAQLQALGKESAEYMAHILPQALSRFEHVYVALHVPPFQETCWYDNETPPDDDDYLPHFTCKHMGDVLVTIADQFPHKKITVLCGHTHGWGEVLIRPNLYVITSGAVYGKPTIARIFSL
ncbi:MAG: metallophosphoesterase [Phototrophicaceae bacterium]